MVLQSDKQLIKDVEGEIIFSFQGELTATVITDLLESLEVKLDSIEVNTKTKKKLFYIVVELVQNLFHHSQSIQITGNNGQLVNCAYLVVARSSEFLSIITGNFVKDEKISEIVRRIEDINGYTKEELKNYYKQVLTNQEFSPKGGGGLGLIDVARKAEGKFIYSFTPHDNKVAFFQLQVNINPN